jgi:hypothetical protein
MSNGSAPNWPNFQGQAQLVGTSPSGRVTVYVDPNLGNAGTQNAQDLFNDADRVWSRTTTSSAQPAAAST